MIEKDEIKARLSDIQDVINAKIMALRELQADIDKSVGPILDAPTTETRAKLAQQRHEKMVELETITAELELLQYRRLGCESELRRIGEVMFTPPAPRYEPLPEKR